MSDGPTRAGATRAAQGTQGTTVVEAPATASHAVRLPPGPRLPKVVQGLGYAVSRTWTYEQIARRHGDVFTMNLPVFGRTVIVADPQLAKQLFMANTDDVGNIQPNLSRVLGKGSVFALDGADHRLPPQAADAAVPRQEHQELREDLRRGDAARIGELAGGPGILDPRADDADHAQCHPARGVRRRRRTARRASAHHSAVGHPGLALGGAADADAHLRPLQPVGQARRVPASVRRRHRQADRPTSRPTRTSTAATTCSRCCCAAPMRTVRRCRARTSATSC